MKIHLTREFFELEEILFGQLDIGDEFFNEGGPGSEIRFKKLRKTQCIHMSGDNIGHVARNVTPSWVVHVIIKEAQRP